MSDCVLLYLSVFLFGVVFVTALFLFRVKGASRGGSNAPPSRPYSYTSKPVYSRNKKRGY